MEHTGFVMHLGFIADRNLLRMHIRLWDGEGCKEKAVSLMGGTVLKFIKGRQMRLRKISYYVAAFLIPAFIQIFVLHAWGFIRLEISLYWYGI